MRVMVIVKANKKSEAGEMPSEQLLTEMMKYNEELANAGLMVDGAGLHPSSKGARIRFRPGSSPTVTHGPFEATEELISGYWIWNVKSMDEALEWAKRCPISAGDLDSVLELRPFFETEDFGEELTPELRDREAALRQREEELRAQGR
jgi:hypothetical protein